MHELVKETKERSGWSVGRTLEKLEISRTTYYRWLREEAWAKPARETPVAPVQAFEALPEEKQAVLDYAREHPELRHRELAWRMVDEDKAYLSASTVYRILRSEDLVCRHRGRRKRYREDVEKAQCVDERWGTDLMYVTINDRTYYFVAFIDEYSRQHGS